MKLLETIIAVFIITTVLTLWVNFILISNKKLNNYSKNLQKSSEKTNLYNYSNYLVESNSKNQTWYIYFSWNSYHTGNKGKFFYKCNIKTGTLIKTNKNYTGTFCEIKTENQTIYNNKIF